MRRPRSCPPSPAKENTHTLLPPPVFNACLSAAPLPCRLTFCDALLEAATAYGIADCWQWKPLLDGKQVGGVRRQRCLV